MCDPPQLVSDSIRLRLLRDPAAPGAELSQWCADTRQHYEIPGSPTDARQPSAFHTNMEVA